MKYRMRILSSVAAMMICFSSSALLPSVRGEQITIISDDFNYSTFTGIYETVLGGGGAGTPFRAPHLVNLPGGLWKTPGGNPDDTLAIGIDHQSAFSSEALHIQHGAAAAITLAGSGGYTKPAVMTISADFAGLLASDGHGNTSPYLGFWPVAYNTRNENTVNPFTTALLGFTGLRLGFDGSITLYANGVAGTPIAFTGTFDPAAVTHLSYQLDTTDGTISNVFVQGSTSDYSFAATGVFTDAATAYAGVGMEGTGGFADNFLVVGIIPEPASIALLGCAGLLLMRRR